MDIAHLFPSRLTYERGYHDQRSHTKLFFLHPKILGTRLTWSKQTGNAALYNVQLLWLVQSTNVCFVQPIAVWGECD